MAKRRVGPGRRSAVVLVLLGFVLVATGVIARRVHGVSEVKRLREARATRDALEAERIRLEGAIREATSRARLVPLAEQRLNMHIATPEQQIFLPKPTRPKTPRTRPHDSL